MPSGSIFGIISRMKYLILCTTLLLLAGCEKTIHEASAQQPAIARPA
jgi:hypothetical protein